MSDPGRPARGRNGLDQSTPGILAWLFQVGFSGDHRLREAARVAPGAERARRQAGDRWQALRLARDVIRDGLLDGSPSGWRAQIRWCHGLEPGQIGGVTDNDVLDQRRAKQVAEHLVEQGVVAGPLQLLRSGANHVFRAGEHVLRISKAGGEGRSGVAASQRLAEAGVPVLSPRADLGVVEGVWASVWDYVAPDPATTVDFAGLGRGIARLHALPAQRLADVVPLPWYAEASWLQIDENLDLAARTGILDDAEVATLRQVCEELRGWDRLQPGDPVVVCHGDVHPANVLMHQGRPVIIDWDQICLGPPAWDHAALLTWPERWGGGPTDYSDFAIGYGKDFSDDPLARRLARVRLIAPTINMARLGASHERARIQAKARMRYWMGESDAPQWTPL